MIMRHKLEFNPYSSILALKLAFKEHFEGKLNEIQNFYYASHLRHSVGDAIDLYG